MATSPTVRRRARPTGTFERVVVPIASDDPLLLRAAETAASLAAQRATVVVVCVLEVQRELPLDALFPEEEERARAALHRAAAVVEAHGVHAVQRLERAHSAAPAILDLVDEYDADLIVLGLPSRTRRGRSRFGLAATAILRRARCRVLIVTRRATS
jgi:nucleotide-binding universal stress UspA family protein